MTSERFFGLIPAAGTGERMGQALPKQYLELLGRPMLYHSVKALLADARIEAVFVVLAPADHEFKQHPWGEFGERVAPLYCGGATRHDSVLNGLVAASSTVEPDDWILVHDAARPCLAERELQRLLDTLAADDVGGILGVPVADTLKRADFAARIQSTEAREHLWQAQTPQMFRHGLLLEALGRTARLSDEAGAVEAMGLKPKLVQGSCANLKVTYLEDLQLAQAILASRGTQTCE
jgi:2-C-methyl-D-erythritol 4-phosphate cytidylyltransferase